MIAVAVRLAPLNRREGGDVGVREQEIVRLLLTGGGNKEIAHRLRLSENTIKGYMKLLMRKLGVNNRAGIIAALLMEK